jgi:hypothetical protein
MKLPSDIPADNLAQPSLVCGEDILIVLLDVEL